MEQPRIPLTKIIATLGPASASAAMIERLLDAGVSIFRLNFSHGSRDDHAGAAQRIRAVARRRGLPAAILGDLQGPKIRIGKTPDGGISLDAGNIVTLAAEPCLARKEGSNARFSITWPQLVEEVQPGERVLINDGAVRMLAVDRSAVGELICTVTLGGCVTSGKGINLPESKLSARALSDRDRDWAAWAVDAGLDFLALSFVRSADEVIELRSLIAEHARAQGLAADYALPIVAKIEHPAALTAIDEILDASDGIMVARGDLGVELELARVPIVQRELVEKSQAWGKPVIVATQMLESMIRNPSPTRAEISDVANAIFAGVDAVMLSGETAVGSYPALAVDHMRMTALATELHMAQHPETVDWSPSRPRAQQLRTAALMHGACVIARDYGAKVVAIWSQKGGGARMLSQNNMPLPILAMSSDERALRQMQLMRGVCPHFMQPPDTLAELTRRVDDVLLLGGFAEPGDRCLLIAGTPLGTPRVTNAIAIHEVGSPSTGFG
ncbi:MAG: pyruvate kinase [Phycisphaerales bacterium]